MCLVCIKLLSDMKDFSISRQYNMPNKYEMFTEVGSTLKNTATFYQKRNEARVCTQGVLCCFMLYLAK